MFFQLFFKNDVQIDITQPVSSVGYQSLHYYSSEDTIDYMFLYYAVDEQMKIIDFLQSKGKREAFFFRFLIILLSSFSWDRCRVLMTVRKKTRQSSM